MLDVNKCDPNNFGTVQQYERLNNDCQTWQLSLVAATAARTTLAAKTAADNTWTVAPNPATNRLTIRKTFASAAPVELELVNTLGQLVVRQSRAVGQGQQTLEMSVPPVSPGLYLLHVTQGADRAVQRVCISR